MTSSSSSSVHGRRPFDIQSLELTSVLNSVYSLLFFRNCFRFGVGAGIGIVPTGVILFVVCPVNGLTSICSDGNIFPVNGLKWYSEAQ